MPDPRIQKLADVLVNYSVTVKKDQVVCISGPPVATPLICEIYRQVLRAGGHAFVETRMGEIGEIAVAEGSDDQLKWVNPVTRYVYENVDCYIGMWAETNTRAMSSADPKKVSMLRSSRRDLLDLFMRRAAEGKLKWSSTQYPTNASAQDAEMSLSHYEDFVFSAGLLHLPDPAGEWRKISQRQQRLVEFLNGKSDYHVVAANGTDVRMSVKGMTWINCDGHENFPDGEVFTGPVLDSVNGQINFSFPAVYLGREVQDVKLTFRDGKVVDARAGKGEEYLIGMLDMDAGSRFLGECAIGTNYGITRFTRNTLFDEKIGGTVHFAVGAGYPETGNTNKSGLHWDMVVDLRNGGFAEIDGQKINVDGRFTQSDWPNLM